MHHSQDFDVVYDYSLSKESNLTLFIRFLVIDVHQLLSLLDLLNRGKIVGIEGLR